MSDTTTTLAAEAIAYEGADAYFPGCDVTDEQAIDLLAQYLADNPELWTPAGADTAWSFDGSTDELVALALVATTACAADNVDPDEVSAAVAACRTAHATLTEQHETIDDLPPDCTRFTGDLYYGRSVGGDGIEVSIPLPVPDDRPDSVWFANFDGERFSLS